MRTQDGVDSRSTLCGRDGEDGGAVPGKEKERPVGGAVSGKTAEGFVFPGSTE